MVIFLGAWIAAMADVVVNDRVWATARMAFAAWRVRSIANGCEEELELGESRSHEARGGLKG